MTPIRRERGGPHKKKKVASELREKRKARKGKKGKPPKVGKKKKKMRQGVQGLDLTDRPKNEGIPCTSEDEKRPAPKKRKCDSLTGGIWKKKGTFNVSKGSPGGCQKGTRTVRKKKGIRLKLKN